MTALENLPPPTERDGVRIQQRHREKEVIRRRLAALYSVSPPIHEALDQAIVEFNGQRGDPQSFDRLEQLLAEQAYRLCYWRVASDEINYRRFFDINALAAIRVEDPEVFEIVHAMIFRFIEQPAGSTHCASIIPTACLIPSNTSPICNGYAARPRSAGRKAPSRAICR